MGTNCRIPQTKINLINLILTILGSVAICTFIAFLLYAPIPEPANPVCYDLISISKESNWLEGGYYNLVIRSKNGQIISLCLQGIQIYEDAKDKSYIESYNDKYFVIHLKSAGELK